MGPASRHRLWYQHVFILTAFLLQISLASPVNFDSTAHPINASTSTLKPVEATKATSTQNRTTTNKSTTNEPPNTTVKTTTIEASSTVGLESNSSPFTTTKGQLPIESNENKTTSQNSTASTGGSITGTPIVFPSDGVTENALVNETNLMPTNTPSTSVMPSLELVDYRQVCGKRMYPKPRIVGGSSASFGRWPWQISLGRELPTYMHHCGAVLLNENWAITAAHCVYGVPQADLILRLGAYSLAEEEPGFQERQVGFVELHPQFDAMTLVYDLALLRFFEPIEFQPNIVPVCLPDNDESFIGRNAFVTGWGKYEGGRISSVLREVSVPVISNTICESMYRNSSYFADLQKQMPHIFICAGWRKGGYDACRGDSGGPMVIQRDDKRFLLAGVTSWGKGCGLAGYPGVYTRISEVRDWINDWINKDL